MLPGFLGGEVDKLVVPFGDEQVPIRNYVSHKHVFTVHMNLLCACSRYFQARLGRPLDQEVLKEAILFTKNRQEFVDACVLWEPAHEHDVNPYPAHIQGVARIHKELPAGYVSSVKDLLKRYHEVLQPASISDAPHGISPTPVHAATIPKDRRSLLDCFIYWLYA